MSSRHFKCQTAKSKCAMCYSVLSTTEKVLWLAKSGARVYFIRCIKCCIQLVDRLMLQKIRRGERKSYHEERPQGPVFQDQLCYITSMKPSQAGQFVYAIQIHPTSLFHHSWECSTSSLVVSFTVFTGSHFHQCSAR